VQHEVGFRPNVHGGLKNQLSPRGQLRGSLRVTLDAQAKEIFMLYTLVVVLLVLWVLGQATSYTAGGLVHILLVVALITVLVRVFKGRNPIRG